MLTRTVNEVGACLELYQAPKLTVHGRPLHFSPVWKKSKDTREVSIQKRPTGHEAEAAIMNWKEDIDDQHDYKGTYMNRRF